MSEKEIKGFCPNCAAPLYYAPTQKRVHCFACDCEVTPEASLSADRGAVGAGVAGVGAATAIPATINFDSAESALIYLENFFETYDWSSYKKRSDYTMYEIDELISTNKAKNGASAHVWYLDFKALSVPLAKKLEALEEYAQQIADKYDPEDSAGAFEIFDLYRRIINRLDAGREAIFKQLETDIKYAERFSLDGDKLDEIRAELENLRTAFDEKVHHVKLITEVPAYVNAKNDLNEKKRAELLSSAGVDAQQVYESAMQAYTPNAVDNNHPLSLFEQIRGYGDSVDHINNINKYFNYHSELFHFSGKTFIFRHPKVEKTTLNVGKPDQTPAAAAPDPEEEAQVSSLALYEIVDGEPSNKPIVKGIDQILTGYGSRLYYFKRATSRVYTEDEKKGCGSKKKAGDDTPRFTNSDGLYCYNFATDTEECLDRSPLSHYRVKKGDYDVRLNRAGNVMFFKKKLPIRKSQEKVGCLTAFFKGQPAPEIVQQNNNYSVLAIDLKRNAPKVLVDAMVDIADYYEDSLFYIQAEETPKKRLKEGEEKPKVKTHLMVCNVNSGVNSTVLNEGCKIHNVVDGKIIYSVWTPNDYNNDLRVYDMQTGTDTLIEQNALDYRCTLKNYVYYTVGNDDFCPLMRNSFDGTERLEIMERVDNIVETRGDWLYIRRGSGHNAALFKLSADGTERIFLCAQFKCFVKITEDYLYYLDAWDNLHIVRPDGKENRIVATDLDIVNGNIKASIIVASDCIYYVRREYVEDDRVSKSLYKMELDGHNIRKLVFDIDKMLDYDEDMLYYSKYESMRYKVTIPAAKKKDESSHYETRRLHKFFTMSKETGESSLILTLNRPHGKTSFKKGCFGKEVSANIIYKEDPVIRAYKRRNVAKVGSNTATAIQGAAANLQNSALGKLLLGKKGDDGAVVTKIPKNKAKVSITPITILLVFGLILCAALAAAILPRLIVGVVLRFLLAVGCLGVAVVCFGVLDGFIPFLRNIKINGRKVLAALYVLVAILSVVMAIVIIADAPWEGSSAKYATHLDTNETEYISIEDYESYYLEITPNQSGFYAITGTSSSEGLSATLYKESSSSSIANSSSIKTGSSYNYAWSIVYAMNAGETYIVRVDSSSYSYRYCEVELEYLGSSSQTGRTKESAYTAVTDTSYTVSGTNSVYYQFTPSASGSYIFKSEGSAYDPEIYIYSSISDSSADYSSSSSAPFSLTATLTAGNTYIIAVKNGGSSSDSFSFSITSAATLKENGTSMSLDQSYTVSTSSSNDVRYYKFTPSSTDSYIFASTSTSGDPNIKIYTSASSAETAYSATGSGNFNLLTSLSSGTTYYIEVSNNTSSSTASFSFKVAKIPAMTSGTSYTVSGTSNSVKAYYKFTPSVTATYTFASSGSAYDPDINIFNSATMSSTHASHTSSGNFALNTTLTAGTTYYIQVYNDNSSVSTTNFSFKVSSRADATAITAGPNYTVDGTTSSTKAYYKFTPETTGNYAFSSSYTSSCDPDIYIYSSVSTSSYSYSSTTSGNFNLIANLSAGTTYYIEVYNDSSSTYTFSFTVARLASSRAEANTLALGESNSISYSTYNTKAYYKFTPTSTGSYTFISTTSNGADPDINIYNSATTSSTTSYSTGSGTFNLSVTLNAGTTYYIEVWNDYSTAYTFSFAVIQPATSRANGLAISTDVNYAVQANTSSSSPAYFRFTPSTSGNYTFKSANGNGDPDFKIFVSTSTSSTYASNTSSGHFNNTVSLTAGTTYYIEVYDYNNYTFTFSVSAA